MATRVRPPHRVIEYVAIAIQRLGIAWPPRATHLLPSIVAQRIPRPKLIFLIELADKTRLVEGDGQWAQRHAVHATAGIPWHHGIRANEPANRRVIIPRTIEQQSGFVTPLPGVVEHGLEETVCTLPGKPN